MSVNGWRFYQGLPIGLARSGTPRERRAGFGRVRGFTLLELMAVVLIITIFAALAIPTAVGQLRDRRVQEAARRLGLVYREARMRALGRGSAVLVRFTGGEVTVHEARVGGGTDCANLPVSSCLNTTWGNLQQQRVVDAFKPASASGEMQNLALAMKDTANNAITALDICFTPMGRAFARRSVTDGTAFTPLAETFTATLSRPGAARSRDLVLMPNGTTRLTGS